MRALVVCLIALPAPAPAQELSCTFTTLCSPQTDCQRHDGVPFRFEATDSGLRFAGATGDVDGTLLPHLAPPAFGALFEIGQTATMLLSVTGDGAAVMTEQTVDPLGGLRSVSYYGTCAPET